MAGSDGSYDSGEASHRALHGIQKELERHPIVTEVYGFPAGEFTQLVGQLETKRLDLDREDATLTVRWLAGETAEARPEFSFHYSDRQVDVGWHHESNPHVDGWGHFQRRYVNTSRYSYEPRTFPSHNPTQLVWEIMSRLSSELEANS